MVLQFDAWFNLNSTHMSGFGGSSILSQLDIINVMKQKLSTYAWHIFIWTSRIGGVWTMIGVLISAIQYFQHGRNTFSLVKHVNVFYPMSALRQFFSIFFCCDHYVNEVIAERVRERREAVVDGWLVKQRNLPDYPPFSFCMQFMNHFIIKTFLWKCCWVYEFVRSIPW